MKIGVVSLALFIAILGCGTQTTKTTSLEHFSGGKTVPLAGAVGGGEIMESWDNMGLRLDVSVKGLPPGLKWTHVMNGCHDYFSDTGYFTLASTPVNNDGTGSVETTLVNTDVPLNAYLVVYSTPDPGGSILLCGKIS